MDEKMLQLRKKSAEKNQTQIEQEPIYIGNERFSFERKEICDHQWNLLLPKEFVILPEEAAKIKYPNENRPKEIWTSLDLKINFGFNGLEQTFPEMDLPKKVREVFGMAKKLNENYQFSSVSVQNIPEGHHLRLMVWYSFISPTLTDPVYNLCTFQIIENQIIHGIFNCEASLGTLWQAAALKSFSSITSKGERL